MNILHLEDDSPLREILAAALKAVEPTCEIHQFAESDNAVQYALEHAQAIDLFILDIRVPGSMDGLEVARRIRSMKCPGAIVLTSAYRAPSPELIKELNCEWYPKPWHIFKTTTMLFSLAQRNRASIAAMAQPASDETKPDAVAPARPEDLASPSAKSGKKTSEMTLPLAQPKEVKPTESALPLAQPEEVKPIESVLPLAQPKEVKLTESALPLALPKEIEPGEIVSPPSQTGTIGGKAE